jgi:hypothetical protein
MSRFLLDTDNITFNLFFHIRTRMSYLIFSVPQYQMS